ncbi:hypothetical protein LK433_14220 (plasmid) [Segatella copri DSM 18205]|nr:hypothetical protein LK433_14220 [Segatella copri DSM 18205]
MVADPPHSACRSEPRSKVLNYINERLTRWVMRKYKRFSKGKKVGRAYEWLVEYAAHNRNEFSHWVKGFVPYPPSRLIKNIN